MEEDWILKTKQLFNEISSQFEEIRCNELKDLWKRADDILEEEKRCQRDEEELLSLKSTIASLKTRRAHQEMHGITDEDEESSARLGRLQTELQEITNVNEERIQMLKDLVKEVVELERDKENQVDKMKRDFDLMMKQWKIYKAYLDFRIVFESPDVFKIGFSSAKGTPTVLTLRSTDYKSWGVLEVEGHPGSKEELISYLDETGDLVGLITKAKKMCRLSDLQSIDSYSKTPTALSTTKVLGNRNF